MICAICLSHLEFGIQNVAPAFPLLGHAIAAAEDFPGLLMRDANEPAVVLQLAAAPLLLARGAAAAAVRRSDALRAAPALRRFGFAAALGEWNADGAPALHRTLLRRADNVALIDAVRLSLRVKAFRLARRVDCLV